MKFPGDFHALRPSVVLVSIVIVILGTVISSRMADIDHVAESGQRLGDIPYGPVMMEATQRPSALFVGDNFPAGYGGIGRNAYPHIVCYSIGLNCGVDAQAGTGFVNDGRDFSSSTFRLIDRLPTARKLYNPDFVIIDAGRNDLQAEPPTSREAVAQYLRQVKRLWPAAKIVVIAPYYLSAAPDADYAARLSLISPEVASHDGILIDPLAEGWYEGVDVSAMLQPDGLHPNQAGQEFIAQKLGKSLLNRGIGQSGATN